MWGSRLYSDDGDVRSEDKNIVLVVGNHVWVGGGGSKKYVVVIYLWYLITCGISLSASNALSCWMNSPLFKVRKNFRLALEFQFRHQSVG